MSTEQKQGYTEVPIFEWEDEKYENKVNVVATNTKDANIFVEFYRKNKETGIWKSKSVNLTLIKYFNQEADKKKVHK